LSYVAGVITGNPAIHAYTGPRDAPHRQILPSNKALSQHSLEPLVLRPKEHLGILNGTAFSCAVGTLALHESIQLAVLTEVCTALGVEAMLGCAGSFARFVSDVARPHPGQVEVAATVRGLLKGSQLAQGVEEEDGEHEEMTIEEDKGKLRQDRYSLRTAPQFIGPQVEDLQSALKTLGVECNSSEESLPFFRGIRC
jgi:phenylalanine ammonia-lyase